MAIIPNYSCRGKDAEKLLEFIGQDEKRIGDLAEYLERSVRYVHSICREDERFQVTQFRRWVRFYIATKSNAETT